MFNIYIYGYVIAHLTGFLARGRLFFTITTITIHDIKPIITTALIAPAIIGSGTDEEALVAEELSTDITVNRIYTLN